MVGEMTEAVSAQCVFCDPPMERVLFSGDLTFWTMASEIDYQAAYNACVLEILAATVRRINAPTLAALQK